jgi:hypothetical protein
MSDEIDLGDGHVMTFFGWYPDRALNPQWPADKFPDVERAGVRVAHQRPDGGGLCHAAINFDVPVIRELWPAKALWQVEQMDPFTASPSLLCLRCGDHGFIRQGRWVRA